MGTTPNLGLPYPEVTDRVADGWDAIRDLAAALDTVVAARATVAVANALDARLDAVEAAGADTGWVNLSLQNGWVNHAVATYGAAAVRRIHGVVHLRGLIKDGTHFANLFTVPAGFRPPYALIVPAVVSSVFQNTDTTSAGTGNHSHNTEVEEVAVRLTVTTAGGVALGAATSASNAWLSLCGITWPAS
jgi:hypothetical protein